MIKISLCLAKDIKVGLLILFERCATISYANRMKHKSWPASFHYWNSLSQHQVTSTKSHSKSKFLNLLKMNLFSPKELIETSGL